MINSVSDSAWARRQPSPANVGDSMSLAYTNDTTAYTDGTITLSFLPNDEVLTATSDDNPALASDTPASPTPSPTTPPATPASSSPASSSPGPSGKLYAVTTATNLRSAPNTEASVTMTIPAGTLVGVQCKTTGEAVTGPWGTDPYWDQVVVDGSQGYLTDEYVNTQSDETNGLIPNC
jgi:hypothetical protein